MLVTVFALFQIYLKWREHYRRRMLLHVIKQNFSKTSLVIRKGMNSALSPGGRKLPLLGPSMLQKCAVGWQENTVIDNAMFLVSAVSPQLTIDLNKNWTSYIDKQDCELQLRDSQKCYVVFELVEPEDAEECLSRSLNIPSGKRVRIQDFSSPIAWQSGNPYCVLSECCPDDLVSLACAFSEGTLVVDDMLEVQGIVSVEVQGHAASLLRTNSESDFGASLVRETTVSTTPVETSTLTPIKTPLSFISEDVYNQGSNESLASTDELLSIKADFKGLADDSSECSSNFMMDRGAGEAPSEPISQLAPEIMTPQRQPKPPNVVVYCGMKDSTRQFEVVRDALQQCLCADKYAIYHLKHENVLKTPWGENAALLVISSSSERIYDNIDLAFFQYFSQGGTVVSFTSALDNQFVQWESSGNTHGVTSLSYRDWNKVTVICGSHYYKLANGVRDDVRLSVVALDDACRQPVIIEALHDLSGGVAMLSQVNLDRDPVSMALSPDIFSALKKSNEARFGILTSLLTRIGLDCHKSAPPSLTPTVLYTIRKSQKEKMMHSIQPRLKGGMLSAKDLSIYFVNESGDGKNVEASKDKMPVLVNPVHTKHQYFDFQQYKSHLKTKVLGQAVVYGEVTTSTMQLIDGFMFSMPHDLGLVAIAGRQTQGKGRGGNVWLSPVGCAMFSLHVKIPLLSNLGQSAGFVQHLVGLAAVQAVRTLPGYENINLRLKWPNDVYFGNKMKLGGVVVNSSVMQDTIHANIGCGINVSNKDPTVCVNDLIAQHNEELGTSLKPLGLEELIGRTITILEQLIKAFQDGGKEAVLPQYYNRWLHSNTTVRLESEDGPEAHVEGVDEHGYLLVKTKEGHVTSVQPDGNSFDIMKNLIFMKAK